jgi:thioredoxin 1
MSETIQHLTDDNFETTIQKGVTLVDFHANWCGPCRMLAPVLEKVANEMKGQAMVAKIDIDQEQATATKCQITSVPTMILFKNGKEVNRLVGLRDQAAIKKFIESAV